jgi:NADH:ubiquinone oxidoreductase subunit E
MMNANNLEKIVVCTGPTCTKNGGGKKLKNIVEEMAAPLGVRMRAPRFTASTDCR